MKLASFSTAAIPKIRIGIVQDNEIIDVDLAARLLTSFHTNKCSIYSTIMGKGCANSTQF